MSAKQKLLRGLGYCSFTFSCLVMSIYLTFPGDVLGQRLAHEIALESKGKVQIQMDDVSLYGLTGVSAEGVTLRYDSGDGVPHRLQLDEVDVRVEILPLMTASMVIDGSLRAGKGTVEAEVERVGAGAFRVDAEIDELNLMSVNIISEMAGLPILGVISGDVSLDWSKDVKTRTGEVNIRSTGLRVGPGELSGGALGKLTLPAVGFGKLDLGMTLGGGKLSVAKFDQQGGDLLADIKGDVSLRSRFASSSVSGCVKVKGDPAYLAKNPTLKSALELATVRLKKDTADFLNIPLAGTMGNMRMRGGLCRDGKGAGPKKGRGPKRR
ncbi:MAG: type II secretion system protein GspN [Deltaproteobacteria bacterium]|jgi:type II secretion system protein N|nr:type II secretion system protein GspN [Deltaproteobacteria bacterium]MBT6488673.1 type II secretion system protein GspN [Deltaproteobacteria bacterium]